MISSPGTRSCCSGGSNAPARGWYGSAKASTDAARSGSSAWKWKKSSGKKKEWQSRKSQRLRSATASADKLRAYSPVSFSVGFLRRLPVRLRLKSLFPIVILTAAAAAQTATPLVSKASEFRMERFPKLRYGRRPSNSPKGDEGVFLTNGSRRNQALKNQVVGGYPEQLTFF